MAKKNTVPVDATAPAGSVEPGVETPAEPVAAAPAPPTAPKRRLGALPIAGIVTGSVLAAGLLFGGGVALGVALPNGQTGVGIQSGMTPPAQLGEPPQGGPGGGMQRPPTQRDGLGSEEEEGSSDSSEG